MKKKKYNKPKIELYECKIEKGFAGSINHKPNEIESYYKTNFIDTTYFN